MKRLLLVVLLTGMLAPAANGEPLPGFRESVRLSPIASDMAGRPVTVLCATSPVIWRDTVQLQHPEIARSWAGVYGLTPRSADTTWLAPWVCSSLERWMRGKTVKVRDLTLGILALSHEVQHLRGVLDEGEAECAGLRLVRTTASHYFHVKKTLGEVVRSAFFQHGLAPDVYRTVC